MMKVMPPLEKTRPSSVDEIAPKMKAYTNRNRVGETRLTGLQGNECTERSKVKLIYCTTASYIEDENVPKMA